MKLRDTWYEQMRDEVAGAGAGLTNFNKESRVRSLLQASATGLEEVSFSSDTAYQNLYAATAKGEALTVRARELGRERKPAAKATTMYRFYGPAGTAVPVGTKVATADPLLDTGALEYQTISDVQIAPGESDVDTLVEAMETGPKYNVPPGTIETPVGSWPAGITGGTNPSAADGGADIETDEDLRQRVALSPYRTALGQPPRFWESLATDVVGVARARCISGWAGANTFKILVWSRDAEGDLVPASSTLADAVDVLLQTFVIPGVELTVAPAAGPAQDVTGYLEVSGNWEAAAALVQAAIEDLFPTDKLVAAEIVAAAMGVSEVTDFRLANPKENVEAVEGSIYAGVVRILPMEWDGDYAL